jgi:hypothetical protein
VDLKFSTSSVPLTPLNEISTLQVPPSTRVHQLLSLQVQRAASRQVQAQEERVNPKIAFAQALVPRHVLVSITCTFVDSGGHCVVAKDKKADKAKNVVTSNGMDVPHVDDETSKER